VAIKTAARMVGVIKPTDPVDTARKALRSLPKAEALTALQTLRREFDAL